MGATSRRKGARGEREAAAELRRLLGTDARRGCQFRGTPDSPDVVTDLAGVHVEVKRAEHLRLYPSLEQAIRDAGERVPVVLHRMNNRPWVAIVRLADLPRLAEQVFLTIAENN